MNNNIAPDLEKIKSNTPVSLKISRQLDKKLKALDRFEKINGKSADTFLERGKIYIEKNSPTIALNHLKQSLSLKKSLECIHKLSICYGKLNKNQEASELFEKHLKDFEWSGAYWSLLAYYKKVAGDYHAAFGAAHVAINKFDQAFPPTWRIIRASTRKTENFELAYELTKKYIDKGGDYSRELIEAYLDICLALEEDHAREAMTFLENTSFDWKQDPILLGQAGLLYTALGHFEEAITMYQLASKIDPEDVTIRWNYSLVQLRTGRIKEGFENYKIRWKWNEFPSPKRIFDKPNFNTISKKELQARTFKDAKIMIWYEQGIGDQLRFYSALPKFLEEFPNSVIEPSTKTEVLLNNSFPDIPTNVNNLNYETLQALKQDFDFHIPVGDMFLYVMNKYGNQLLDENFSVMKSYLVPDKLRSLFWKDKLNNLSQKPKIGFAWRSGVVDLKRSRFYTNLKQWEKLFMNPNFSFVNLQYDLSHDQLQERHPEVKEYFLDTGFLDQKDDLEGAQALISNLDFVISPASTPGMMASASGIPTVIYHKPNIWSFGRIGKFVKNPIYENTQSYHTMAIRDNSELVNDITDFVINFFEKKSC